MEKDFTLKIPTTSSNHHDQSLDGFNGFLGFGCGGERIKEGSYSLQRLREKSGARLGG